MDSNQNQVSQPSGSPRSTSLAIATGHPDVLDLQIHAVNPLHTLKDPSKARARPYLYSSCSFPVHVPLSSFNLSSSASTPSHTTATPSPVLSVQTPSTRYSSLQPPSTRPSPAQPSSIALPRDNTRAIPSKRVRDYIPSPSTLYRASPIPPSSERPTKRPRLGMGPSSTGPDYRGPQPPPPSQPSAPGTNPSRSKPRHKKAPLHPLAVDYGRPIQPVVPRSPFCHLSLRQNRVPLPPYPEIPDSERLLEDELKGPIDPAVAGELGDLMWMQQKRVWGDRGGYSDPFLGLPIPTSTLGSRSSSLHEGATPAQPAPEVIALYGPLPRSNESTHLGERLANPSAITVDDDEDGGFGEVLDLYRGAVQGSALWMELELAVGGDAGLTGVSWEAASSLEISIGGGSGEPQEPRIRTLAEYKRVVEAEKAVSLSEHAIPREEPPLGIEWSYSCCGYAAGKVVNFHSANVTASSKKRRWQP